MKGIILAGGSGTRLYPITKAVSKQLLPLYDKPMIYYPLSVLMLAEIRDILIITTPEDNAAFKRLLGDGSKFGINLSYEIQEKPNGIAEAFIIGEKFIGNDPVCLILGDNIFHGNNFSQILKKSKNYAKCNEAGVFGYYVNDPERYGVVEFDEDGECINIEEKPTNPKSKYAVVGLYFYPKHVAEKAKKVKPSARGELEITTLNNMFLEEGRLHATKLPRGFAWLDTGTFDSLADASHYIETIEKRQGQKVACLEEIAFNNGWLTLVDIEESAKELGKSEYGKYLMDFVKDNRSKTQKYKTLYERTEK
ncbi:MAG: glucose-1-phosphate thymidylyltransferase RfbA [Lachnospiraceae bacterium]|nr:glucose-1-phosphate thymidylyltransferase RfbA [Lachnospiraceae bacterium]